MPRKKNQQAVIVKYLLPEYSIPILIDIVNKTDKYKQKQIWVQKFYHLLDYITLQNLNQELDCQKDYVNIHMETMASILSVDNSQLAEMLRSCTKSGLLKKDGLMKRSVKEKQGKKTVYIEHGKSFGYQFTKSDNLKEVEITDNRSLFRKTVDRAKTITDRDDKLKKYQEVISLISIDTNGLNQTFEKILERKYEKNKLQEDYEKFIRNTEYLIQYRDTNIIYTIQPFNGVIVPVKVNPNEQKRVVLNSEFCKKCTYKVNYIGRKRPAKVKVFESDATTIARCNKAIFTINNGYMVAKRPIEGSRVYCDVTNLKRELREHLRLNGRKLCSIDIRNSQPLIASILIKGYWLEKGNDLPDDVISYQKACEKGIFYDEFMTELNLPDNLRNEFKADFFKKVFFSMVVDKSNLLKEMFIEKYPKVWEMICDEKGGLYSRDYNEFANKLQKVEAAIIFDYVNIRLIELGILSFNIFDSIYVTCQQGYEKALELLNNAFSELDIHPTFNIEGESDLTLPILDKLK